MQLWSHPIVQEPATLLIFACHWYLPEDSLIERIHHSFEPPLHWDDTPLWSWN